MNDASEKKRLITTLKTYTIAFVILTLFSIITLLGISGVFHDVYTHIFPRIYYSQSFADITINGKTERITSTGRCIRKGGYSFLLWYGFSSKKYEGGIIIKKLPSGEAIVIKSPLLCHPRMAEKLGYNGEFVFPSRKYGQSSFSSAQIARYFWLNNANNPSRIEIYTSRYFAQNNIRFDVDNVGFRYVAEGQIAMLTKIVPRLKTQTGNACGKKLDKRWFGLSVHFAGPEHYKGLDFEEVVAKRERGDNVKLTNWDSFRARFSTADLNARTGALCIGCTYGDFYFAFVKESGGELYTLMKETAPVEAPYQRSKKDPKLIINTETKELGFMIMRRIRKPIFCDR